MTHTENIDRRRFGSLAALGGCAMLNSGLPKLVACETESSPKKLPVAAVVTVYKENSHADVIVGKILEGFRQDGQEGPNLELVSMYVDQFHSKDLSRELARKHSFRIATSIDDALTAGQNKLAVSGVLSIGEHGDYPYTPDTHQHMYPRRRFFDEIVATFRRVGQTVPVFNDKHLSYRWEDALHMVQTARELKFPFLAGSSVPVAWRRPGLELPRDCQIESALAVGYGGLEAYGFHALEGLQCMIERRTGGETGVAAVQAVQGTAIDAAAGQGRWSEELLHAAIGTLPSDRQRGLDWKSRKESAVYLIDHKDGLRSSVVMASGLANDFAVAIKLKGVAKPLATWLRLEDGKPYGHFAYLVRAIDHTIHTRRAAYPVERTLLTTGILDAVMHSLSGSGRIIETPELDVSYTAADWPYAGS